MLASRSGLKSQKSCLRAFLSAAIDRTPACPRSSGSGAACPSAAPGRILSCHRSEGTSTSCPSGATGRTPSNRARIQRCQLHALQGRQVGHLCVLADQGRQRHPFQRRQVGHRRVGAIRGVSGIPFSGDRSDTGVCWRMRVLSGMPFSGDRSDTFGSSAVQGCQRHSCQRRQVGHLCVGARQGRERHSFSGDRSNTFDQLQSRVVKDMSCSGNRSARRPLNALPRQDSVRRPASARTGQGPSPRRSGTPGRRPRRFRRWA